MDTARLYLRLRLGMAFCFGAFSTVSVLRRITVVGLDPLELALVGTALEVTVFLFEVPTGVLADLRSRRLSFAIGHVLVGVGFAIEAFSTSFASVLVAQATWGLGWTFISGAREAWLADEVGDEAAARAFVSAVRLASLARLAGIGAAVALGAFALHYPMRMAAVGMLALGVWARWRLPETGFRPSARSGSVLARMVGTLRGGAGVARARTVVALLLAIAVFQGMAGEGIDRLWEFHFLTSLRRPGAQAIPPVVWLGVLNAVSLLLSMGILTVLERRLDASDERRVGRLLLGLHAVLAAAVLGLAFAPGFAIGALAFWMVAALRRVEVPYTEAWLNKGLDSATRATVMSMHGQCGALGEIGGGPLLGGLARLAGVRVALAGASALLLPALALYARALARVSPRGDGERTP